MQSTLHATPGSSPSVNHSLTSRGLKIPMRIVGKRSEPVIGAQASGELLAVGCRFNDEIHRLPTGNLTHIPKGLYRFMTHAEANAFDDLCLAKRMAQIGRERGDDGRN